MKKRWKLLLVSILFIIPTITNSGSLTLSGFNHGYIPPIPTVVDTYKEWRIHRVKQTIMQSIPDVDTSFYFRNLKGNHLLIMDSLVDLYRIPKDIYYRQILRESWYIDTIVSSAGAVGYAQIMYDTYLFFKDELNLSDSTRLDVHENLTTGAYYMRYLKNRMDKKYPTLSEHDKWLYVLAAYNGGIGRYKRALREFKETKGYVKFILAHRS